GPAALDYLSRLTGGRERVELASIWREMPRHPRLVPLAPWLILAAVVVFLLEVLERLTGVLSAGIRGLRFAPRVKTEPIMETQLASAVTLEGAAAAVKKRATIPAPPATETPKTPSGPPA